MVSDFVVERVAKEISGEIVWSDSPAECMRKWRELFNVSQSELARRVGTSPSVINDYERGRRSPGSSFVKKYVKALIEIDRERGWPVVRSLARSIKLPSEAVLDMREFPRAIPLRTVAEAVKGEFLWGEGTAEKPIYGYTILDSLAAIVSLSGMEFYNLVGMTAERALVFTNVGTGRSPMVAVRVSPLKPGAVIVYGPKRVDPLAVVLAEKDGVPLILSKIESTRALVRSLKALASST